MKKIVLFGEALLRLQAPSFKRIVQAPSFEAFFGGSEANSAVALAQMGANASYVTKLPKNEIGQACVNEIRKWGVDTRDIVMGDGRMGIYFTEKGASQRPAQILYDREGSVFANATPVDFDFNKIFDDTSWFHISGITPALSDNLAQVSLEAVKIAKSKGIKVSCDFNYRSKLWNLDKAKRVLSELVNGIDVLIINENQAKEVFCIDEEDYRKFASILAERMNVKTVVLTKRRTVSGEVHRFSAMIWNAESFYSSREYSIFLIDKIGGGDAFSAALIYALVNNKDLQYAIDFAAASACYKHSVEGDMAVANVAELENLMNSDGSGRFVR
jgi:2-dehydro-3-deoxygluconokinase